MLNSFMKKARILIVDDQESNIALLESVLERNGYADLESTTDPRQVVGLLEKYQPDLILLDLLMPHLDGFAVMKKLQVLIPAEDFLPILVLTADITPETKLRALAAGAHDFLTKPFDVGEVTLRIRNLLETRQLHLEQKNQNRILEEKVQERTAELRQRVEDLALINSLNVAINRGDDIQEIIVTLSNELHRVFDCIGTITAFPGADNKTMRIRQLGSMLIIPLISGTETYGLLEMVRREQSSEAELLRIQDIAGHLAAAIGRKLAEERISKSLREKEMRGTVVMEHEAGIRVSFEFSNDLYKARV
jgi:response regulator RpfG family c-di-GMP phosphodiesterase